MKLPPGLFLFPSTGIWLEDGLQSMSNLLQVHPVFLVVLRKMTLRAGGKDNRGLGRDFNHLRQEGHLKFALHLSDGQGLVQSITASQHQDLWSLHTEEELRQACVPTLPEGCTAGEVCPPHISLPCDGHLLLQLTGQGNGCCLCTLAHT